MAALALPLRLWPYFGKQRPKVLLAILAVLPDPLLMVGIPVLLQLVIDRAITPGEPARAIPLLVLPCLWL
ncbi:MAG: hypothetical protein EB070_04245, partial [Synechococcaceae bacterium WBA_2_066]|nr:hypothetical protein [Synechococcaceae bacterium WBA_2_066]